MLDEQFKLQTSLYQTWKCKVENEELPHFAQKFLSLYISILGLPFITLLELPRLESLLFLHHFRMFTILNKHLLPALIHPYHLS